MIDLLIHVDDKLDEGHGEIDDKPPQNEDAKNKDSIEPIKDHVNFFKSHREVFFLRLKVFVPFAVICETMEYFLISGFFYRFASLYRGTQRLHTLTSKSSDRKDSIDKLDRRI